ncbi:glycosyltransferase [Tahibacter amnicola]|uniref:Glycosyltransferase n=1 Tax=Tahibacter amnicola TaxID=2976241 RepID=A0ABY6BGI5_9GAMM|nr:glycosyltransferase [Tahibacter amnicola]UXI67721.1 glycosyltransferase [Tahibacter amnicola]
MTSLPFATQICLCMIVRDEAAVIERCLASVRGHIAAWAVVDTGSSDATPSLIRHALRALPGQLVQRPWVDFSTNRNQALDLAGRQAPYALILDADEVLETEPSVRFPRRLQAPGYFLRQRPDGSELEYRAARLLRCDAGWRWHGVLHEYPVAGDAALYPLDGLSVRSYADGARSRRPAREKYRDDARVLERALARDPHNLRYRFYLAQSLRDAGDTVGALETYRTRAAGGGWDEEAWYAAFQVAVLLERLDAPGPEVVAAYRAAYAARICRAEPLCELARYLRMRCEFVDAHRAAAQAASTPAPPDLLFVDQSVYRWRAWDEQALAAWHLGHRDECARICRGLLQSPLLPMAERPRVAGNLAVCG